MVLNSTDLQFDAHLRHVTRKDENELRENIRELTEALQSRDATIVQIKQQLRQSQR